MDVSNWIAILGFGLQIFTLAVGGIFALGKIDSRLKTLTNAHEGFVSRLDKVDIKLEGFGAALIQLAKQEERMTAQDARLQELSNRSDSRYSDLISKIDSLQMLLARAADAAKPKVKRS